MARPDDNIYTTPRGEDGQGSGATPSTGGTVLDETPQPNSGNTTDSTPDTGSVGPDDSRGGGAKQERSPLKAVYAPSSSVNASGTQKAPVVTTTIEPRGRDSGKELRISRFLGLMTRPKRGEAPLGALQDMKNLLVNKKTGALVLRHGMAAYTLPTTDVSGTVTLTGYRYVREYVIEVPSAQTTKLVCGTDAGVTKHIYQTPFFPNSSSVNTGSVEWGERIVDEFATVSGTSATFTGGYNVADYFKYWVLYNQDRAEYVYVVGSSYLAGTTTLTLLENAPSDWAGGDILTLYRHFHDNPSFSPSYATDPIALQQGQGILFSGGQSSSTGCKPILSLYISKTLFTGASKTLAFTGTYVTEAEIKTTAGFSGGSCSAYTPTSGLGTAARWFMAYVLETDDGQRSQLIHPSSRYADLSAAQGIQSTVTFTSQVNKRFRYLHTLLGYSEDASATTLDWSRYYHVGTTDLAASGFTYTESTTTPGTWTKTIQLASADYEGRGADANVFLGHTEANNTTVSFSKAVYVNNRLFVARYYDYTAALNYDDQIRYSVFASNGVAQLNVLADVSDATESQIEQGDSAVIRGLARYDGKLFIVKDNSCFYVSVDFADIVSGGTSPSLTVIARIGCDVDGMVCETPFGIVFGHSSDDIYLWDGGYPRPLTRNYRGAADAVSTTSGDVTGSWYDIYTKTYNFPNASNAAWYSMSFDSIVDGEYVWTKHTSTLLGELWYPFVASNGFSVAMNDALTLAYQFSSSATSDAGTGIPPYFKTAPIVLSERHVAKASEVYLALEGIAGGSGTLDLKLTTTGAVNSGTQTYSSASKTETLHVRRVSPLTGRGRQFEFEYNANAFPATFTALQVNEFGITYDIVPTRGDSVKTA